MKKIILGTMLASVLLMANQGEGFGNRDGFKNGEGFSPEKRAEKIMSKKSKITQKIDGRIAKLQKAKECVKSATTPDELRKCRPKRKGGKDHKGKRGFKGHGAE